MAWIIIRRRNGEIEELEDEVDDLDDEIAALERAQKTLLKEKAPTKKVVKNILTKSKEERKEVIQKKDKKTVAKT